MCERIHFFFFKHKNVILRYYTDSQMKIQEAQKSPCRSPQRPNNFIRSWIDNQKIHWVDLRDRDVYALLQKLLWIGRFLRFHPIETIKSESILEKDRKYVFFFNTAHFGWGRCVLCTQLIFI